MGPGATILAGVGAFSVFALPMTYGTFVPASTLWGNVISHGDPRMSAVALTFDDGPTSPYTGEILDALAREDAKATFFVLGENAERQPELVRRMHDEGHAIGNHTWSHPHYGWIRGSRYWRNEIRRTSDWIQQITGQRPTLFRPPLGAKTILTLRAARALGHEVVMWSRRSFDGLVTTPDQIMKRLQPTRAGDIILLHDGIASNNLGRDPTATVKVIGPLLAMLKARQLSALTLDALVHPAAAPSAAGAGSSQT
jgi:peptidoglycan-N-acetylglucosamine deacetylase